MSYITHPSIQTPILAKSLTPELCAKPPIYHFVSGQSASGSVNQDYVYFTLYWPW